MKRSSKSLPPSAGVFRPSLVLGGVVAAIACAMVAYISFRPAQKTELAETRPVLAARVGTDQIQLDPKQVQELKVGPVGTQAFELKREAIGNIDFNQDNAVQVFSPYQGRIGQMLVRAGEDVTKGQVLYTVQIPDLAQAAATLISAAGTLRVANETVQRAKGLYEAQSIAQKEYLQNVTDQQAADAAYRAARKSIELFGLSAQQIAEIELSRKVDTEMPVRSPFAARVTARTGASGLLVQPGSGTPPVILADLQKLWMVASVPESEVAAYRVGQSVQVRVQAYPDKVFAGKVNYIGDAADPNTHRIVVRAEVVDPQHQLKAQMLATFSITVGAPVTSVAVPQNALAREGDGSMSVWTTQDHLRFRRKVVKTGWVQDGMVQITEGLSQGEKIAQDKALFLSNLYLTTSN